MNSSIDSRATPRPVDLAFRAPERSDLPALDALLGANMPIFSEEERRTELEMIEASLDEPEDEHAYRVVLARRGGATVGFA